MKRCSSVVWKFFDRIENEHKRCYAVLCKLCDTQYKFFGNTTNLRTHLINKHPLQWELSQNGSFDESTFRVVDDEESNQSTEAPKRRKQSKGYKDDNVRYSVSIDTTDKSRDNTGNRIPRIEIQRVDVLDTSEVENDQQDTEDNVATFNLVRQLHDGASDEEWLEEDAYATTVETYHTKPKRKYKKIKREVQTPPRRVSTFTPHKLSYEKPSPIIIEQPNNKDEYSVFGEYVANKLRKFKTPRTRGNLQQLITTILWQAEYGTYDNADAVKRVLLYTAQEADNVHEVHVQSECIVEARDEEPNQSADAEC